MTDQYRYEERYFHCPIGCGYKSTHRAVDQFPDRPCPRCNGARLREFRDDRAPQIQPAPITVDHPTEVK